ncbi:MAG: anthranilate phosphoribosyltransferase [Acidobacteriota bacterium]
MLEALTATVMKGGDLTESESARALESMLSSDSSDVVIASFLTALSLKGETPEEICGFARVMRAQLIPVGSNHSTLVDTAGTGGGSGTFNISTTAAFAIAGAGLPVAKHGNRAVTSRSGSADMLAALGVNLDAPLQVVEQSLRDFGLAFIFAPLFHPAMKRVVKIRRQLSQRTIFNLLGPLTNPAGAPFQIIGVYSPELTQKVGRALSLLGCTRRAWVVSSEDGLDELSSRAPSTIVEVEKSHIRSRRLDPEQYGFQARAAGRDYRGGTPEENAEICRAILEGRRHGPARDVVLLNAAAAIHVAGETDFQLALARAEESLNSGAALEKLQCLVQAYSGTSLGS